jgi:hypothetical protein
MVHIHADVEMNREGDISYQGYVRLCLPEIV